MSTCSECERLRDELASASGYAEQMVIQLAGRCFPELDEWQPLSGDMIGLLTQIDNMTAGLVRRAAAFEEAAGIADAYELIGHPRLSPGSEINAWWSGQEYAAETVAAAIRSRAQEGR